MLKRLRRILTRRDKLKLVGLAFASIIASGFGVAGVGSIVPFMALLGNPQRIHDSTILTQLYTLAGSPPMSAFLLYFGLGVIVVFFISNGVMALNSWLSIRFSRGVAYNLTRSLFHTYLARQYEFFLNRNPSELTKNVFMEVGQVVANIVQPGVDSISKAVLVLGILIFLVALNPVVAIVTGGVLGASYTAIYWLVRNRLQQTGKNAVNANRIRFGITNEAFGAIKDVKVLGKETSYRGRFDPPEWQFERSIAVRQLIQLIPKYLLECIAYSGILAVALYLFVSEKSFASSFPLLSAYALGGYRLIPALQTVFSGVAGIRGTSASLEILYQDLVGATVHQAPPSTSAGGELNPEPIVPKDEILLKNVTFGYGTGEVLVADSLNLRIEANTTVGLVGHTGCGKTTILDILLGLLQPQAGGIYVDGRLIDAGDLRRWQMQLGYVPQSVYLSDDTVVNNIAFGVTESEIDMATVRRAAKIANIDDFVTKELDNGYDTIVGDRGIRLSGGERQRIAIARALYRDPSVVIMDEATSALDNLTERAVINAIENMAHTKTIVMVAHRLTTLKGCDLIYVMDRGRIIDKGTYGQLSGRNEVFRYDGGRDQEAEHREAAKDGGLV